MLWPVEADQLHSTDKATTTDGVVTYPSTWKMYIKYTADGKTYEKRINFPNTSWEAGKKYHLTIVFADKMVELKTEVKPWEYEELREQMCLILNIREAPYKHRTYRPHMQCGPRAAHLYRCC